MAHGLVSDTMGMAVVVTMGYAGEELLPCGRSRSEEVEIPGPRRSCIAGRSPPHHRAPTLPSVPRPTRAPRCGHRHGRVPGAPVHGGGRDRRRVLKRITQHQEGDLPFSTHAGNYGPMCFSVKGDQLRFFKVLDVAHGRYSG